MSCGYGFVRSDKPKANLDEKVERTAVEAARCRFSPEFMNRIDKVVVFHPLQRKQLEQVLDIELSMVQQRVLDAAKEQFLFTVAPTARDFLLKEVTDQRYGARHLKRAIERHVVCPFANLLATDQVRSGDLISIDCEPQQNHLTFARGGEKVVLPARQPEPVQSAPSSQARPWRPTSRAQPAKGIATGVQQDVRDS